jgi:two-component system, NarL family, invasion response regulator UvrY
MLQNRPESRPSAPIRVFLADDHPLVLAGLKRLLLTDEAFELVGEAINGAVALDRAIELRPDVLVLDLWMPGLNGFDVGRRFLSACPTSRVVVLTALENEFFLRRVVEKGLSGFVLKRSATDQLLQAIHAVAAGRVYLDAAFQSPEAAPDGELRFAARLMGLDKFAEHIIASSRRPD